VEVNEKKDRVTDALNATKAAVEEGIVPGKNRPDPFLFLLSSLAMVLNSQCSISLLPSVVVVLKLWHNFHL
jgi:hypothetical protein